jgi:hypothetical protein
MQKGTTWHLFNVFCLVMLLAMLIMIPFGVAHNPCLFGDSMDLVFDGFCLFLEAFLAFLFAYILYQEVRALGGAKSLLRRVIEWQIGIFYPKTRRNWILIVAMLVPPMMPGMFLLMNFQQLPFIVSGVLMITAVFFYPVRLPDLHMKLKRWQ